MSPCCLHWTDKGRNQFFKAFRDNVRCVIRKGFEYKKYSKRLLEQEKPRRSGKGKTIYKDSNRKNKIKTIMLFFNDDEKNLKRMQPLWPSDLWDSQPVLQWIIWSEYLSYFQLSRTAWGFAWRNQWACLPCMITWNPIPHHI